MGFKGGIDLLNMALALAVAGLLALQLFRCPQAGRGKRFIITTFLRSVALGCIILSLLGLELNMTGRETATIFLVDRSLSAQQYQNEIETYLNRQIEENRGSLDQVAVVSFAAEPMIDLPFTAETDKVSLNSSPDPNSTNIQKALEFCRDYFLPEANKRLVVFSDGRENAGAAWPLAGRLSTDNINIAFYPLNPEQDRDVQLTSLQVPSLIHPGEKTPLEAVLDAGFDTEGTFYLFAGSKKLLEESLELRQGTNKKSFYFTIDNTLTELRGEIDFSGDENGMNNTLTLLPRVKDFPPVLLIGEKKDMANLDSLVDSLGLKRTNCLPAGAPANLGGLIGYGTVILVNTPYDALPTGFIAALDTCVREAGTGLLVIGGEKTFALGGYRDTLLEGMLPVSCRMKGNKKQPNTGLVLAVDCSGSMDDQSGDAKKIEMVKKAAAGSVDILEEEDYVGVLAFSDVVEWVVPFQQVKDKEEIKTEIEGLAPRGGTVIIPALQEAQDVLEQADARVKHIILLTDGQGETGGYEPLLNKLRDSKITLSTVAVGMDAERTLLEELSQKTAGRSYYTDNLYDVSAIFARETYLGTKKYLNNRVFQPIIISGGDLINNYSLPVLKGYVGTGFKERAELLLKSDRDDPILARWQYGTGRVVVWTADLSGQWSKEWLVWESFQEVWGKIINSCQPALSQDTVEIELDKEGCDLRITVNIKDDPDGGVAEALITDGEQNSEEIDLKQVRVGMYQGTVTLEKPGDYLIQFCREKDGKTVNRSVRPVRLDYSPEYSLWDDGDECFCALSGGQVIGPDADIFDLPLSYKNNSRKSLDFLLLPVALAAFVGEIWARKNL